MASVLRSVYSSRVNHRQSTSVFFSFIVFLIDITARLYDIDERTYHDVKENVFTTPSKRDTLGQNGLDERDDDDVLATHADDRLIHRK